MRMYSSIALLIVLSAQLYGQQPNAINVNSVTFQDLSSLTSDQFAAGRMVRSFSNSEPVVEGDIYYFDAQFLPGSFSFVKNDKKYGLYLMRLNLKSGDIEISLKEGVRAFSSKDIKAFTLSDTIKKKEWRFVNAESYTIDNVKLSGFIEVIEQGEYTLYKRKFVTQLRGEYRPLVGPDSGNDKIIKKSVYYIGRGSSVIEVKDKKSLGVAFGDLPYDIVTKELSSHKVNFKDENSLIQFVHIMNTKEY
jgi:hypothetical protein